MARIVVIGSAARDEVIRLVEPLRAGAHLSGVEVEARLGGGGANTAVALAAAGHAVTLLTAVGHDAIGAALLSELAAAGVDTTAIQRLEQPTTRSWVLIDPNGERTIINVARCELTPPPEQWPVLAADLIYVRSRRRDLGPWLTTQAASALIVAHVPPLEPGARPAQVLVGSSSDLPTEALHAPAALGRSVSAGQARWTVVTAGAAGACAYADGEMLTARVPTVQPVDTTGAGDAFAAGLLHALAQGRPMAEALAVAVRFGAEATLWPTSGLPAVAVRRLLAEEAR